MASPQGSAIYKKKEGVIAVSDDHTRVTWTPVAGGASVTLATASITSRSYVVASETVYALPILSWQLT